MTTPKSHRLPWVRLFAETVAIVLSILIAFALDAWWDDRRENAEQRRYLVAIAADFEANQELLRRYESMYREVDIGTRALIGMLEGPGPGAPVSVPDSLVTAAAFVATYDPSRAAYEDLLNGGGLASIRNEALRHDLAAWPPQLEDALENETFAATLVLEQLLPTLGQSEDLKGVFDLFETYWVTQGFPDEWRNRTTEVLPTEPLVNLLRQRAWRYWLTLEEFQRLHELQDSILSAIRTEIHGIR